MNKDYSEIQQYPKWIWLIALLPTVFTTVLLIVFSLKEEPKNSFTTILLGVILPIAISLYIVILERFTVSVQNRQLFLRFRSLRFLNKTISIQEIKEAKTANAKLKMNYGYHRNLKNYHQYNVASEKGVELLMKNGKYYFISSNNPQRLLDAIQNQ